MGFPTSTLPDSLIARAALGGVMRNIFFWKTTALRSLPLFCWWFLSIKLRQFALTQALAMTRKMAVRPWPGRSRT